MQSPVNLAIDKNTEGGNKMQNRHRLNILTSLVAASLILSLFSGIAAAQTPGEQYEKDKEQYNIHKQNYERTKEDFENAKGQFEKALRRLNNTKNNRSGDELKLKARDYFEKAIDHIAAHLEVLKYRAQLPENKGIAPFDVPANVDALLSQLEQVRSKVQQANTVPEFKEANMELKELWVKIKLETRYDFALMLNHRIDNFLTKADNVSVRLDAAIQRLKSEGKDTAKLEEEAANYKNLVNQAKDNQMKTIDPLTSHNGFAADGTVTNVDNARAFLIQIENTQKETIQKLRAAARQLQDFSKEFRKLSGGKAAVGGTEASGNENRKTIGNSAVAVTVTPKSIKEE